MLIKNLLSLSISLTAIALTAGAAHAASTPDFGFCANPTGTQIASYNSGSHGVVGSSTSYTGRDTVYKISSNAIMQCLCPESGDGIQTNWWKIEEKSRDEIEVYKSQGWIFVADGSAWGLDQGAYLAKNLSFSCNGGQSGGGSSSGGDGLSDGRSDGRSSGSILGLANTGNGLFITSVFLASFSFLASGAVLSRRK